MPLKLTLNSLQTILILILIEIYGTSSYPAVYGTTRYGRSSMPMRRTPATTWMPTYALPPPLQRYQKPQLPPLPNTYYDTYPYYAQDFIDEYYYPPHYPIYYVPTRQNDKHRYYPGYYYEQFPRYRYDYEDPVEQIQEEIIDEDEGQQQWYDNEDGNEQANAAFLQNLMMYNNEPKPKNMEGFISGGDEDYLDQPDYDWLNLKKPDQDGIVKELKQLPKELNNYHKESKQPSKKQKLSFDGGDDMYVNWLQKRKFEKKVDNLVVTETPKPEETTAKHIGQKEVVMLRPSTPVYHPFAEPFLDMFKTEKSNNLEDDDKRGSVYDTIKQLLSMEDSIKEANDDGLAAVTEPKKQKQYKQHQNTMKKRFVSSEGNLVNELTELKKMST